MDGWAANCIGAEAQAFEAGQSYQKGTVNVVRQCYWGFECLQILADQEHTEFKKSF